MAFMTRTLPGSRSRKGLFIITHMKNENLAIPSHSNMRRYDILI